MKIVRTQKQVDDLLNRCADMEGERNPFFGMTYQQGIEAGIQWILGETDDDPLAE